jgi:hypothetical protein
MEKLTLYPLHPVEPVRLRQVVAAVLHALADALARLAHRLHLEPEPPAADPVLEFYADASAPEGALYVDGRRVGVLHGVTRL